MATYNDVAPVVSSITAGTGTALSTSTGDVIIWVNSDIDYILDQGNFTSRRLVITNTTTSISPNTGALVVVGGVGVSGNLYANEIYDNGNRVITEAFLGEVGVIGIGAGDDIFVTTSTGFVTVHNISTLESVTGRGSVTGNPITLTCSTATALTATSAEIIDFKVDTINSKVDKVKVTSPVEFSATTTFQTSVVFQSTLLETSVHQVNTTGTILVDSYSGRSFRSCKSIVQIEDPTVNSYQLTEVVMMLDKNGILYKSEYGIISTDPNQLGTFTAEYQNGLVNLYFTAFQASNKIITVTKTALPRYDASGL